MQHVDGLSIYSESLKFTRKQNHWHAAGEWGQSAKWKIILCSSVARAGDKS